MLSWTKTSSWLQINALNNEIIRKTVAPMAKPFVAAFAAMLCRANVAASFVPGQLSLNGHGVALHGA